MTYHDQVLANGLRVVAVRHGTVPLVEIRLQIDLPRADGRQAARAAMLAACLNARNVDPGHPRPALELAGLGAELTATLDQHGLVVSGRCPASALGPVLRLLRSTLRPGTPPAAALARQRDRLVRQLRLAQRSPLIVVRTALLRHLFGAHPMTIQLACTEEVVAVTGEDVAALWQEMIVPGRARVLLLGDLAVDVASATVEALFGSWAGPASAHSMTAPPQIAGERVPRVHDGRLRRAYLSLCADGVATDDARYPALCLAANLLGGLATSRLARSIRDHSGLVYVVTCYTEPVPGRTLVHVATDTTPAYADEVLARTHHELARLGAEPPTAAEVDAARTCMIGSFATRLAPQAALADAVAADLRWHRAAPETFRFKNRLRDVTTEQVEAAVAEFLHPNRFTGILAGP